MRLIGILLAAAAPGMAPSAALAAPADVDAAIASPGFVVDGASAAHDRTLGVLHEKIGGNTDRFVLRFKKPR